jgi:hypothetical protein
MDKYFYNEASASKLGWEPSWFGCTKFNDDLIEAIEKYQKSKGLTSDGMCGPSTYRRIYTDRQADIEDFKPSSARSGDSFIIYNSEYFDIKWPKVKLWFEADGLKMRKGFKKMYEKRDPSFFVCHWDVCLSSESCFKVLHNRGLSVHFLIDNDGTIYQTMDMNDVGYHAGSRKWNNKSIGVEISNAYYPKYQDWYVKNGLGERPIVDDAVVHGKRLKPFTGFYPEQIDALQALMRAVNKATGIPLKAPLDRSKKTNTTVSKKCAEGRFEGFISHYHLTSGKIDCAGLDLAKLLKEVK